MYVCVCVRRAPTVWVFSERYPATEAVRPLPLAAKGQLLLSWQPRLRQITKASGECLLCENASKCEGACYVVMLH